jgi:excisionase family DNA binding protein
MNVIFTDQNEMNRDSMEQRNTPSPDIRYYTYAEVAKILRCSEKTLYNRVRSGQIKPLHNGRLVLFTEECIVEFLKQ